MRERTSLMWLKNTDMCSMRSQGDALEVPPCWLLVAFLRFCYQACLSVPLHGLPGVHRERISVFLSQIEAMVAKLGQISQICAPCGYAWPLRRLLSGNRFFAFLRFC